MCNEIDCIQRFLNSTKELNILGRTTLYAREKNSISNIAISLSTSLLCMSTVKAKQIRVNQGMNE